MLYWRWKNFGILDIQAMECFFEKMAARGWMLKDAIGNLWGFERQEPREIRFSVVILKDVSMWEGSENEASKAFRFYCESAGWHFVCAEKCRQILWSEDRNVIPVETEEELKMLAVKTQLQKQVALTMFTGVFWSLIYFWPALAGGAGMTRYFLRSLLETNAGLLVLTCMFFLLVSGLLGIVSYLVWYGRAKRNLSRNMPVKYRPYALVMVKDMAEKAIFFLLLVFFYITVVRVVIQEQEWKTLANILVFFTVFWCTTLFSWSRRKKGFRWRYLLFGIAVVFIAVLVMYKIDSLPDSEPSREETWMTGDGPFIKCSELFTEDRNAVNGETDVREIKHSLHTRSSSVLLEKENYRTFPGGGCENEFSYTLYKSGYQIVLNYIRKLSEEGHGYRKDGDYWDGSIYVQRYFYREYVYGEQAADESIAGEKALEETYRVSILRNGPYILVIRYKDRGPDTGRDAIDSRAAERMRELPGIL